MLSLHNRPVKVCDGITRREMLRVGGLGALGLSLPGLLRARETPRRACCRPTRRSARPRA